MKKAELRLWSEFESAYNAEFKNLPFDSADEEFLFKRGCWWAWQASRAAIVVELPGAVNMYDEYTGDYAETYDCNDVKKSLDAAGVKYNERN